ncbi:hypothetical protein ACFZDG_01515 [Kitasatospora xanthocidica]|uniref:hypothetical protein n=1 Tax=Kitasatospora xanthocidica TaxID=83382 RepID=UPI0036EBF176
MAEDLVTRAHWGDLTGQNWAGLVRLSFEVDADSTHAAGKQSDSDNAAPGRRFVPLTGRDIKGRDEQEKDARQFVESRGGRYVHTCEEPDTSAWKRKRVRLPDGQVIYRVIRPVFEGALANLKEGLTPRGERLDGLIVYDIDRLITDPAGDGRALHRLLLPWSASRPPRSPNSPPSHPPRPTRSSPPPATTSSGATESAPAPPSPTSAKPSTSPKQRCS